MNAVMAALVCVSGWLSQYAPGVMERVIETRQRGNVARRLPLELPPVDAFIAVQSCNHIGKVWMLRVGGQTFTALVADCAGSTRARGWMQANSIVAEVDYAFAKAQGFVARGTRAELCRVTWEKIELDTAAQWPGAE